jgi:hypothetical protein
VVRTALAEHARKVMLGMMSDVICSAALIAEC